MTAHEAAQAIASRDRSSLYLTSSFFKDRRRYEAFCAHYALMRVVDDRIDALPSRTGLAARQRTAEHDVVAAWGEGIRSCYHGRPVSKRVAERCGFPRAALLFDALGASLRAFRPHPELWTDFFRAMHWDLDHDRFDSWKEFLTYAEGASVAPTTIYLELITSRQSGGLPQDFELFHCGRQLGTFAYLAHVVRDLSKDLRTGENGLVYVSREDMATHGVTEQLLFADAERGRASLGTRRLVCDLLGRAKGFLSEGRASMAPLAGRLDKDCEFVLELIVALYERVVERIESCSWDPMGEGHWLTPAGKLAIMRQVAEKVGFAPDGRGFASMVVTPANALGDGRLDHGHTTEDHR